MSGKILFVDDERKVLDGLRRSLRSMRKEWRMYFCESASDALELLDKESVDVVVSDMRMPGMDGADFLAQVKQSHPDVIRIALSGYSDQDMAMRAVRSAHQYLAKPCDAEKLKTTISRVRELRRLLGQKKLREIVSEMSALPSLPSLYQEIIEELESEDASIKKIGEIVSKDVAMTAKILQLVNSAFFGLSRHVSSPTQAVLLLGLDTIKSLVLSLKIFEQFEGKQITEQFLSSLWEHSLTTAVYAKTIAAMEEAPTMVCEDAFMAGVLHDVGKLILMQNFPDKSEEILRLSEKKKQPVWLSEKEILGTTHGELGAYLLGVWGLPEPIVEAVAYHHFPSECPEREFGALTAVHAADFLYYAVTGGPPYQGVQLVDQPYLEASGVLDRLKPWKEACAQSIQMSDQG